MDKGTEEAVADRHDHERRSAVADGNQSQDCRYGKDSSGGSSVRTESVLAGDVGRSHVRYILQVPQGIAVGEA